MYVNKSNKNHNNTWTPMKLDTEPIVYSRLVYVGSYTEAVTIIKNEVIDQGQTTNTWY